MSYGFLFMLMLALPSKNSAPEENHKVRQSLRLIVYLARVTVTLISFDIPRWICFRMHQVGFEFSLKEVASQPETSPRRIGLYFILARVDFPSGASYFKTEEFIDHFDETVSFGFAYRPQAMDFPFGIHHPKLSHLSGPWYVFRSSDLAPDLFQFFRD
jgi:hypothetical protein